jgi:hypothetical protein
MEPRTLDDPKLKPLDLTPQEADLLGVETEQEPAQESQPDDLMLHEKAAEGNLQEADVVAALAGTLDSEEAREDVGEAIVDAQERAETGEDDL